MLGSHRAVGGKGGLIEPLGFKKQAAIQVIRSLRGQLFRALMRGKRGQSRGIHLVQHLRGLAEGDGVKVARNALQRIGFGLGGRTCIRGGALAGSRCFPVCRERLGLAVIGPQLEALGQLRLRFSGLSATLEADGKVKVIIGGVGIGSHGLTEESDSVVALAADRNSLIIDNFG